MDEDIGFLRNEYRQIGREFLGKRQETPALLKAACKEEPNPEMESVTKEAMYTLIKKLAETYSQVAIARILNEKGLYRENGLPWKQFAVSRYFKEHGIACSHEWKGSRFEVLNK